MRHIRRPSPALVLAFIALLIALGGTALAATGQLVNITDPVNAANKAKVDATGRLNVGDGTGPMTVDGTVTSQQAAPASFVRMFGSAGSGFTACRVIATPPAGKAWVIRSIGTDVYTTGSEDLGVPFFVGYFNNTNCGLDGLFDEVHVIRPGRVQSSYEPGIAVPNGGGLSMEVSLPPNAGVDVYPQGFAVPSAAVPAGAAPVHGEQTTRGD